MAEILDGKRVAAAMNEHMRGEIAGLAGVIPTLAIVRVGERGDDIAYERGAMKRCESIGIAVRSIVLPGDAEQRELLEVIETVNNAPDIHGMLLLRPLPGHMDDNTVRNALLPEKDIDGITDVSLAGVFTGTGTGFPPCTAQACMEILEYYGYELAGKKAVVVGRSLVIGKPVAMLLLGRNATVTVCHTHTADMPAVCRGAEVLIAAAGRAGVVDKSCLSPGQIVIDVGVNVDENGRLHGDVAWEDAQGVKAITPVPGGVGAVTTSVLAKHVIEAAKRAAFTQ